MTDHDDTSTTRCLDEEQIASVRNSWGCGVPLQALARQFGISEQDLRRQIGEPAWRPEPAKNGQRTLFDCK